MLQCLSIGRGLSREVVPTVRTASARMNVCVVNFDCRELPLSWLNLALYVAPVRFWDVYCFMDETGTAVRTAVTLLPPEMNKDGVWDGQCRVQIAGDQIGCKNIILVEPGSIRFDPELARVSQLRPAAVTCRGVVLCRCAGGTVMTSPRPAGSKSSDLHSRSKQCQVKPSRGKNHTASEAQRSAITECSEQSRTNAPNCSRAVGLASKPQNVTEAVCI